MFDLTSRSNNRVLIYAPTGRDGKLIALTLEARKIGADSTDTIEEFCREIEKGAGAAILVEEALSGPNLTSLTEVLIKQPAWADLPLIILTSGGDEKIAGTWERVRRLDPLGNASLLERPLRAITLEKAVQVALRSRRRQYEVKSLHETLENRVADRTAELERLNREAEGFNYTISHDLRAPLRAIISTSHMLLEDYRPQLPEGAVEHLRRQSNAAGRLALLIDELLKLSRLTHQEMQPRHFNISALAHEVEAELENSDCTNGCQFRIEDKLSAFGDPSLIKFVMLNLLQNACKFSPNGGCIVFTESPDGTFCVTDQGIGFDMKYVDKIFLPFERLVGEQEFSGTGIGLANVKRIVERHKGALWAQSTPGHGSTFFFTLG